MKYPNRIREIRQSRQITLQQLADQIGTTNQQISYLELGKRRLDTRWMERIAKALGCSPSELIGEELKKISLNTINVIGAVQAGAWREAVEWPQDEWQQIYVPPDPRYPGIKTFGIVVRGRSMDMIYPEGTILVCANLEELSRSPKNGERVIVERHRAGTIEATVKEFVKGEDGKCWLCPRSTQPEFQAPIPIACGAASVTVDTDEICVTSLVIGSYRPEG